MSHPLSSALQWVSQIVEEIRQLSIYFCFSLEKIGQDLGYKSSFLSFFQIILYNFGNSPLPGYREIYSLMEKDATLLNLPDEVLWNSFREGQLEAVTLLFRRYYRVLYSYGVKISRDEDVTKDCIQEVFTELWNKRETLAAVNHVKPYLLKFLRRRIFHTLHQTEKESGKDWLYVQEFDIELSHEDLLVQEQLSQQMKTRLNQALQKLTPRQREVIYLRFFDGLSCEAISEITTLKYQSVVNLIHEAIKKLREQVVFAASLLLTLTGLLK